MQLPLYSLPSLGCCRARWFSHSEAREWPFSCRLVVSSLLVIKNPGSDSNSLLWLTRSRLYSAACLLRLCAELTEDFRTWRRLFNLRVYSCCASFLFLQVLLPSFWGSGVKARLTLLVENFPLVSSNLCSYFHEAYCQTQGEQSSVSFTGEFSLRVSALKWCFLYKRALCLDWKTQFGLLQPQWAFACGQHHYNPLRKKGRTLDGCWCLLALL